MFFNATVWLRIAQVIGLRFLFVPITLVAYIGTVAEKNNAVAGIIIFMRNMFFSFIFLWVPRDG